MFLFRLSGRVVYLLFFRAGKGAANSLEKKEKNVSVRHFFVCVRRAMFVEWTGYALLLRLV